VPPELEAPQDAALVHVGDLDAPGTHVLLVGIGAYDCLENGVAEKPDIAMGMGQLKSPLASAKDLADWFLSGEFQNPERPLASLAMVVGSPQPFIYQHEKANAVQASLPSGTAAEVQSAVRAWLERASSHTENQTIFYFCGHGVYSGNEVLLCRDYGSVTNDRFDGAINLNNMSAAMATLVPEYQVFLIDACRTPDALNDLLTSYANPGKPCLSPVPISERGDRAQQSVHFAASELQSSYGQTEGSSVYCDALIRSLSHGGAQADLGNYVGTDGLQMALSGFARRLSAELDVEQKPDRSRSASFAIHKPPKVRASVFFHIAPSDAWNNEFTLSATCTKGNIEVCIDNKADSKMRKTDHVLDVDKYNFLAKFVDGAPFNDWQEEGVMVYPPAIDVTLHLKGRDR
jgi:hypothetical protein